MIASLAFYLFSIMMILSAIVVITAKNPVHSVLFLILAFFNAAGLFVLLGAEFVAMLLVIVYVGAVMVLFLFVVMMLDINITEMRSGFMTLPAGRGRWSVWCCWSNWAWSSAAVWFHDRCASDPGDARSALTSANNTRALAQLLYTHYAFIFEASGLILLVAMIGAIVLTHRKRPGVRRQKIAQNRMRAARSIRP